MAHGSIRFLPLRRWEVLRGRTLWSTPITLSNEEGTSNSASINLSALHIYDILFLLYYTSCLSLVVDTDDLGAKLKLAAGGGGWERFEEFDEALPVYYAAGIKFGNAWDWGFALGGVKVDHFLGSLLEGCVNVR
jgi:hypothetical protein